MHNTQFTATALPPIIHFCQHPALPRSDAIDRRLAEMSYALADEVAADASFNKFQEASVLCTEARSPFLSILFVALGDRTGGPAANCCAGWARPRGVVLRCSFPEAAASHSRDGRELLSSL